MKSRATTTTVPLQSLPPRLPKSTRAPSHRQLSSIPGQKPAPVDAGKPDTTTTTPDAGDSSTPDTGSGPDVAPSGDSHIVGPDPTKESTLGTAKGPFATKSYTSGYKDMPGFASGTIWYPTDEAAKPPYGCITVVPGFVSPRVFDPLPGARSWRRTAS